ncbi:unnamed protein product [Amoebophrya sp. A120]|nr:unnamed protein product [Amoebophrya sp. A120]|eukprot:GSA120T00015326001.1
MKRNVGERGTEQPLATCENQFGTPLQRPACAEPAIVDSRAHTPGRTADLMRDLFPFCPPTFWSRNLENHRTELYDQEMLRLFSWIRISTSCLSMLGIRKQHGKKKKARVGSYHRSQGCKAERTATNYLSPLENVPVLLVIDDRSAMMA